MALQSQAPRATVTRRYTTNSRRRKKGLAPWLVLIGVAVILVGLYIIFGGGKDPNSPAPAAASDDGDNVTTPSDNTAAAGTNSPGYSAPTNPRPVAPPPTQDSRGPSNSGQATTPPTYPGQADPTRFTVPTADSRKLTGEAKDQFEIGMQRLESGDVVAGRALLSELLFREGALPRHEAQAVRERLAFLSAKTVFSSKSRSAEQIAKDPILALHKVQPGEYLGTIGNTYRTPYQLIERINGIKANRLQAGQGLQVIRGPIHARIDKSDYRMDLFVEDNNGVRIYLKSYTVGLGEFDSTPIGLWRVKPGSKVGPANGGPSWRNPRTGKVYDRNDPDIPIGEYWMALEGMDENTKGKSGYGIHATNDPSSIGRQESMGCVRMHDKDVDEVFYTLFEGASMVEVLP